MTKKGTFILMSSTLLMYACSYSNVYINREQDNSEGKAFLNKFYSNVISKNYKGVDGMIGDSLKQLAGTNGISKMVEFIIDLIT